MSATTRETDRGKIYVVTVDIEVRATSEERAENMVAELTRNRQFQYVNICGAQEADSQY